MRETASGCPAEAAAIEGRFEFLDEWNVESGEWSSFDIELTDALHSGRERIRV